MGPMGCAVHFLEYSASIRAQEGFRAVLERRLRHKFGRFVQFRTFFRARYVPGRLQRAQIVLTPAEYSVFCTARAGVHQDQEKYPSLFMQSVMGSMQNTKR